jgi:hypothetical protein
MTFYPASELLALAAFSQRLQELLAAALRNNPNVVVVPGEALAVSRPLRDAVPPEATLPTTGGYVLSAHVLRQVPGAAALVVDVAVGLYDSRTRVARGIWRFRSDERDLPQFVEIATGGLLGSLFEPNLGVVLLELPDMPAALRVAARADTTGPGRTLPSGVFSFAPLPGETGVEAYSRPLLSGNYDVSVEFPGRPAVVQTARVEPGGRTRLFFDTSSSSLRAAAVPGAATLRLTNIAPEQAVYIAGEGPNGVAAYFHRRAGRGYALDWMKGLARGQLIEGEEPSTVVLVGLPGGRYVVGTWARPARLAGKTLFRGVGARRVVRLSDGPAEASLRLPPPPEGGARLNVFWTPFGPPGGGSLYVDGDYVGDVFDSGELSVFGLSAGEHEVRFDAPGFRPTRETVTLT